jgi:hypothetical protein
LNNFIFIWIPKCAGTSFVRALQSVYPNFKIDYNKKEKLSFGTHGHVKIDCIYKKQELINKRLLCISRNPYDRMVSLFFYLKKRKLHNFNDFDKFCEFVCTNKIPEVGNFNVKGLSQCNPQFEWVKGIDNVEIFKFEDLKALFDDFGLKLIHLNKTDRSKYLDYFKNKRTIELVNSKYSKDFEYFNYKKM